MVVVDVGANVDCTPAHAGPVRRHGRDLFPRRSSAIHGPRVGMLSIGEEEHKGNELTRAATPLLKSLPINFIGNVEGRDIYTGDTDVIVCDGFIGNVALKVSEGLVDMIRKMLQESLQATITRKIGYVLARDGLQRIQEARGLLRVRRRAAAGRQRRVHHQPRPLQCQRDQERHPGGRRICRRRHQRTHREPNWPNGPHGPIAAD